nr:ABC transporter permease subunit [Candidatus Nanopelagicales bacterium]
VFGGLIGLVARTAAEAMADASGADVLGRLGIEESGARAYVGVSFVFITLLLMAAAAAQVAATRDEEASGRLEHLLVRPVTRGRWLGGRLVVTVGLLVLAAAAAALGALVAGRAAGLGVPAGDLLLAGLNALPAAVFVLGLGTLLHAVVPRAAATLTYAVVAGSFLLEVVGSAVALPGWVLNASVLHHVAPAPAVAPDPRSAAVLLGLGVLLAVLGGVGLRRRDLVGA